MSRPRLLDLFCGAGGAAVGYHRAGFDVVGVDVRPMPHYPFEFIQADALEYLADHGHEYDVRHTSPPCQGYSTITADHARHPRLINVVRIMLQHFTGPYVIENVEGARHHLHHPVRMCGSTFELGVRRHRYFESNALIMARGFCAHAGQGVPIGVYGDHPDKTEARRPNGGSRGRKATSLTEAQQAMGIDWMNWKELTEAIPPVYTEWIGSQLIAQLLEAAA